MQLKKNIFVETEYAGANVSCIVTKEGNVLIDTPYRPSDTMKWKKQVEEKGTVKYIINTESHDDHYAGNFFFNVPVIAQELAREDTLNMDINHVIQVMSALDPDNVKLIENYRVNVPSITYSKDLTLYLGEYTIQIFHLPGHCRGQSAVYIPEEKVIFTGDNVVYKTQGFLHEADPLAWLEAIKRLGEMDIDYIVPGHGEICNKSYLPDQTDFVQECIDKIKSALQQGWTKEEAVERLRFERYTLGKNLEIAGPIMLRQSVENFYDYYKNV